MFMASLPRGFDRLLLLFTPFRDAHLNPDQGNAPDFRDGGLVGPSVSDRLQGPVCGIFNGVSAILSVAAQLAGQRICVWYHWLL
jgi:hypothetical protein